MNQTISWEATGFQHFMEHDGAQLHSQEPATYTCPEFSPRPSILFLEDPFLYYLTKYGYVFNVTTYHDLPFKIVHALFLSLPHASINLILLRFIWWVVQTMQLILLQSVCLLLLPSSWAQISCSAPSSLSWMVATFQDLIHYLTYSYMQFWFVSFPNTGTLLCFKGLINLYYDFVLHATERLAT